MAEVVYRLTKMSACYRLKAGFYCLKYDGEPNHLRNYKIKIKKASFGIFSS